MIKVTKGKSFEVRTNTDALEAMKQAMASKYMVKIGIIGSKGHTRKETVTTKKGKHVKGESDSLLTNVEIGTVHEFGSYSRHIPRRSFLGWPVKHKASQINKYMALLWRAHCAGKIGIIEAYKRLGIYVEGVIQTAFATQGFGQWPKLKRRKGSPLIDTGQLRKSITSAVVTR